MPDFVPRKNALFNAWQKQLAKGLLTDPAKNKVAPLPPAPGADPANWQLWAIPQADVQELLDAQAAYQPAYDTWSDEDARNKAIVKANQSGRKIYEKLLRQFIAQWLRYNKKLNTGDKAGLSLTVPDTERTAKPQLEGRPLVAAEMKGGALLKLQFEIAEDSTRPSMHPDAHALELKYQIGGTEPVSADATNKSVTFTKARHSIQLGVENAGQYFYGFARWINTSENSKSGPYSVIIKIIISN